VLFEFWTPFESTSLFLINSSTNLHLLRFFQSTLSSHITPTMSDSRFARLQTDPRFRRAKQKSLKVEIDDRFKDVLQSEEFGGSGLGSAKGQF